MHRFYLGTDTKIPALSKTEDGESPWYHLSSPLPHDSSLKRYLCKYLGSVTGTPVAAYLENSIFCSVHCSPECIQKRFRHCLAAPDNSLKAFTHLLVSAQTHLIYIIYHIILGTSSFFAQIFALFLHNKIF